MECREERCRRRTTAVVVDKVPRVDLEGFFTRAFVEVAQALRDQGISIDGPPFACYRTTTGDLVEVEAGFPVQQEVVGVGDVRSSALPESRVVVAEHHGPDTALGETYEAIERWMAARRLVPGDVVWEEYLTAPGHTGNPATTRVVRPVRERDDGTSAPCR